jgi:hypothetical protein
VEMGLPETVIPGPPRRHDIFQPLEVGVNHRAGAVSAARSGFELSGATMGQEYDGVQTKKSDRHHNRVLLERHRDLLCGLGHAKLRGAESSLCGRCGVLVWSLRSGRREANRVPRSCAYSFTS